VQTPGNRSKGCRSANKSIKINLFDKKRLKNDFINFAIVRKWEVDTAQGGKSFFHLTVSHKYEY
jgi:hypothetical protein